MSKRHPKCKCSEHWGAEKYSTKYDAWYCALCNKWLERKCGDLYCDFCYNRPFKPAEGR